MDVDEKDVDGDDIEANGITDEEGPLSFKGEEADGKLVGLGTNYAQHLVAEVSAGDV
jgi:hypothetical protein